MNQKNLGVALDLGTTTIQGSLVDLKEKRRLSYFSSLNEQLTFGHDIISRISFCLKGQGGLERLNKRAISSINFVIENLVSISNRDREEISLIAAVGNSAMYHFALRLSPEKLAEPPYEPEYKDFAKRKAQELGIASNNDCEFLFLPNIGGFVGSDAIAVILATGLDKSDEPIFAVDIGTNGEIILGSKDKIWVASTAAGPAFEGWHTSCGMRALEGAIESIEDRGGKLSLKVIGGLEPKGISGSGLIDIIAILLKRGYIDRSGRMKEKGFLVYNNGKKISVSQGDIREIQLAKAAFLVAIEFLRRRLKKDITKFFITGKFGNYLNIDNARTAGIVPKDITKEKVALLEDGALKGAEIFINDRESTISRIEDILGKAVHISLSQEHDFRKEFARAMRF